MLRRFDENEILTHRMNSKSIGARLYDAFTANGAIARAWESAGVTTVYDEDEKTISLSLPEGWTGTMSPEDRGRRKRDWCIDDPTHKVKYAMTVRVERGGDVRASTEPTNVVLFPKPERDDETFELHTRDDERWTVDAASPGSRVFVDVRASATLTKGVVRELPLVEGNFIVPDNVSRDVGGGCPGYFFVVDGGFALIVSVGEDGRTPRRVSLVGKLAKLENDVADAEAEDAV